jgi:hypothetical protein
MVLKQLCHHWNPQAKCWKALFPIFPITIYLFAQWRARTIFAWQIGHLISSERFIMEGNLPGAQYSPLPANFENVHGRESTTKNSNQGFLSKDTYIDLFRKTRAASIQAVKVLKDTDLEKPTTGRLAAKAPTVGKLYLLASHHILMHVGQFSVVRRKLGKPVLF